MTMKAGELHILLHHHTIFEPYPYPSVFYDRTNERFRKLGFLEERNGSLSTSAKGQAYVEKLKELPL